MLESGINRVREITEKLGEETKKEKEGRESEWRK